MKNLRFGGVAYWGIETGLYYTAPPAPNHDF